MYQPPREVLEHDRLREWTLTCAEPGGGSSELIPTEAVVTETSPYETKYDATILVTAGEVVGVS